MIYNLALLALNDAGVIGQIDAPAIGMASRGAKLASSVLREASVKSKSAWRAFTVVLALVGLLATAEGASAQNRWYVEGAVGAQQRMDVARSETLVNLNTGMRDQGTDTYTFDPGFMAALALGYKLPLGFRVAGEIGYAHYNVSSAAPVSANGVFPVLNGSRLPLQSGGNHDQGSVAITGFYDLPVAGKLVPYIGAGGGAFLTGTQGAVFEGSNPYGSATLRNSGTSGYVYPGVLGEVGLNIAISDSWTVVPSYRFLHVITPDGVAPNNDHIIKLGLRYSW